MWEPSVASPYVVTVTACLSPHPTLQIYTVTGGCLTHFASVACQKVHCTKRDTRLSADSAPSGSQQKALSAAFPPPGGAKCSWWLCKGREYSLRKVSCFLRSRATRICWLEAKKNPKKQTLTPIEK